ncbi:hypothetical protein TWF706_009016 [Orbilia oligospora]|nr:hypothetical protein TWF706_009016 [Orbilia oligospora]
MAPIATTNPIFQPYVKELKKRLHPIERAMGQLSPKLIISRDVINSVLADLLVSLQYSVHTPEYDTGQVSYLVKPILEEIRRNLRPNHERRLRWLAAFRRSLQPMHRNTCVPASKVDGPFREDLDSRLWHTTIQYAWQFKSIRSTYKPVKPVR